MSSQLWKECFGDLSQEDHDQLKGQLNKISKLVGLREEE